MTSTCCKARAVMAGERGNRPFCTACLQACELVREAATGDHFYPPRKVWVRKVAT